jgi:hypothetical protein
MKNIKKQFLIYALSVVAVTFVSCNKDDATGNSTLEVASGVVGTVSLISPLAVSQTVNEGDLGSYEYTITLNKAQVKDIHVSVKQISGTALSSGDDKDFEFDNDIVIPAYSTTATGTIHILNDDLEESVETATLQIGFPNTSNASLTSSTVSFTINDCYSNLAGTYSYVTTNCYTPGPPASSVAGPFSGSVTFTAVTSGVYDISDVSFGGWIGLYGPNNIATGVKLNHLCGTLSLSGTDQYNEVFTLTNLVVNGSDLSFHWANDYGEYGDTTLTRDDFTNWPNMHL